MKKIILILISVFITDLAIGAEIIQLSKTRRLAKISVKTSYPKGALVYVLNRRGKAIAIGKIRSCRPADCIVVMSKFSRKNPIQKGYKAVVKSKPSRKNPVRKGHKTVAKMDDDLSNHLLVSAESSFSRMFGLGYQRSLEKDVWRIGLNLKILNDKIQDTSISGSLYSVEVQRKLWSSGMLSLYAAAEAGMVNTEFDFSEFAPNESKKTMSAYLGNFSLAGNFQFHKRFAAEIGAGMGYNTLSNTIEGDAGTYVSNFDGTYSFVKAALRYRF